MPNHLAIKVKYRIFRVGELQQILLGRQADRQTGKDRGLLGAVRAGERLSRERCQWGMKLKYRLVGIDEVQKILLRRQTDRQADRQTGRQTGRQIDRERGLIGAAMRV